MSSRTARPGRRKAPTQLSVELNLRPPSTPDEIASWRQALAILVRVARRIEAEDAANVESE